MQVRFNGMENKDIAGLEPVMTLTKNQSESGTWAFNVYFPPKLVEEVLGWGTAEELLPPNRRLSLKARLGRDGMLALIPTADGSGVCLSRTHEKYRCRIVFAQKRPNFSWLSLTKKRCSHVVGCRSFRAVKYASQKFTCVKLELALREHRLVPVAVAGTYPKRGGNRVDIRGKAGVVEPVRRKPVKRSPPPGFVAEPAETSKPDTPVEAAKFAASVSDLADNARMFFDALKKQKSDKRSSPPGFVDATAVPEPVVPEPKPAAPGHGYPVPRTEVSDLEELVIGLKDRILELERMAADKPGKACADEIVEAGRKASGMIKSTSRKWIRVGLEQYRAVVERHQKFGKSMLESMEREIKALEADENKRR